MMAAKRLGTHRRRWAAAAAGAGLVAALSGCTGTDTGQVPPAESSAGAKADATAEAAVGFPARAQGVEAALVELVAANAAPSRDAVRAAWSSAGFSPESVEVSQDGTPTGLAVDSIVSAAPDGTDCLVGEIRGGKVALTTVPALANGQCLLGDDR